MFGSSHGIHQTIPIVILALGYASCASEHMLQSHLSGTSNWGSANAQAQSTFNSSDMKVGRGCLFYGFAVPAQMTWTILRWGASKMKDQGKAQLFFSYVVQIIRYDELCLVIASRSLSRIVPAHSMSCAEPLWLLTAIVPPCGHFEKRRWAIMGGTSDAGERRSVFECHKTWLLLDSPWLVEHAQRIRLVPGTFSRFPVYLCPCLLPAWANCSHTVFRAHLGLDTASLVR